jgi:hypothetical protein
LSFLLCAGVMLRRRFVAPSEHKTKFAAQGEA